jgi:hypothetical protein
MIVEFAHHVAAEFTRANPERSTDTPVEVRTEVIASLNGRPPQWLVDPTVNLAATPRALGPAPWIVPLDKPLTAPPPPRRGEEKMNRESAKEDESTKRDE